jgi:hypothetical protein
VAVIKSKCDTLKNRHSPLQKVLGGQIQSAKKSAPLSVSAPSLQALTAAALMLPGLMLAPAYAADDEVDFQYSHYQEGNRGIFGNVYHPATQTANISKLPNNLKPIEVEGLHGGSRVSLADRIKFAFNYTQDTWTGATPVGTAPAIVGGNRPKYANNAPTSGIVTGASPIVQNMPGFYLDKKGNILNALPDPSTGGLSPGAINNQLTHVLSYASPETRKQGDFKLAYEWDEAAANVGGGVSVENDYESRFGNLGGRLDFNRKQTAVSANLSYTNSDTAATLDPDALSFIDTSNYEIKGDDGKTYHNLPGVSGRIDNTYNSQGERSAALIRGNRRDWGGLLGLTQVLNKNALLELDMGYTRSSGYMANPYKLVYAFYAAVDAGQDLSQPLFYSGRGLLETRPSERNQFNWHFGYNQYLEPLDAALHFDYHFAHDDWGINAQTLEADWAQPLGFGWTVTPRVRYYSQSSANFYYPFITQIDQNPTYNENTGEETTPQRTLKPLPHYYSSDQRLSGFGALSGGLTVGKQLVKGIGLQAGFEYYSHQGGLKLDGGGEQGFADYDYWVANAALSVNLEALGQGVGHSSHSGHKPHHGGAAVPAGVMFGHTLKQAGDMMVGYRYMRNEQAGDMLNGSQPVGLDAVSASGCGDQVCSVAPNHMAMNMHMLDLMVAPVDGLTLMVMPQWLDMDMTMTPIGASIIHGHNHGGAVHGHQTGGVGDTGVYVLFELFEQPGQQLNLSLGGTAPTGDVGITLRKTDTNPIANTPLHYGMQLGSGTWDLKPSLTYTGAADNWSWGGQLTGTKRLEDRNEAHFAFGDIFQSSAWGGYQLTRWLAGTVRGVYTWQDAISGQYPQLFDAYGNPFISKHVGPFDKPANYGGQFVDLGLGVNVTVPSGAFAGNTVKFEWLQPLHTDYNGYQLDRDGALTATWGIGF